MWITCGTTLVNIGQVRKIEPYLSNGLYLIKLYVGDTSAVFANGTYATEAEAESAMRDLISNLR